MTQRYDIALIGGGLAGLTLATHLGKAGFNVTCIDAQPLIKQTSSTFDGRTTAISYGSRLVLEQTGIWDDIVDHSAAIETIDILDGRSKALLQFDAAEVDTEAFGWVVDNADLRRALIRSVQNLSNVQHMTGVSVSDVTFHDDHVDVVLADGQNIQASLVIGADGRQSFLREKMEIGTYKRDYNQTAVVCLVAHEQPHMGRAIEHFRSSGPFALLPFTDLPDGTHRSALVWTVHSRDAKKWVDCDETIFNAALMTRSNQCFGKIWAVGQRQAWPLNMVKSYSYITPRAALVAEAAHGMHPIAGQGLNMSLRDVAAIVPILRDARDQGRDIGDMDVLQEYQNARRADNTAMTFATDNLTMLFSNDFLPISLVRKIGLRVVSHWPAAKRFFMHQAMGMRAQTPMLPKLSILKDVGSILRKTISRR